MPATLGGGADVGASVVAVGNPLGLTDSVSSGVISGLNRTADTDTGQRTGLIQFDAAVNPGSSGGPLLDGQGLVIGIVVALAEPDGQDAFAGIGFAVPIGAALNGTSSGGQGKDRRYDRQSDKEPDDPGRQPRPSPACRQPAAAGALRGQAHHRRPGHAARAAGGRPACGGHLLVEGVPGLAKTLAVKSLAAAVGGHFQRIQFTPDLVPADLTGTRVYHQHSGEFQTQLGPVFTNLLLADEINRAPAKVQSALLEVMQEHQVTIGRETYPVPEPFLVMATQNPIEPEGTYPLPEAQVDRFMMKVVVGYPTATEEHAIVERSLRPAEPIREMLTPADLISMQEQVRDIYVDPAVVDYAVRLVTATRRRSRPGWPT